MTCLCVVTRKTKNETYDTQFARANGRLQHCAVCKHVRLIADHTKVVTLKHRFVRLLWHINAKTKTTYGRDTTANVLIQHHEKAVATIDWRAMMITRLIHYKKKKTLVITTTDAITTIKTTTHNLCRCQSWESLRALRRLARLYLCDDVCVCVCDATTTTTTMTMLQWSWRSVCSICFRALLPNARHYYTSVVNCVFVFLAQFCDVRWRVQ
jgi:hypothetical protein